MSLFRSRRRGAVDVAIVHDEVEGFERGIGWVSAVDGLAAVADDHVLHHAPHDVVEDGHAEEGEAVGPGNEDGADDDQRDAGPAVEIFLKVELTVTACRAAIDDATRARSDHLIESTAAFACARRFSRLAP